MQVEVVVEDAEGAKLAAQAGADSIEFCVDLDKGGLTPPADKIVEVCSLVRAVNPTTEVHILVLNKPDGFYPSSEDVDLLVQGITCSKVSGATGVVFGALTGDDCVDVSVVQRLVVAAGSMKTTFHRAFDRVRKQDDGVEALIRLGVSRLLTSGKPGAAIDHMATLKNIVDQSCGRIQVIAGGGVRLPNISSLAANSGVSMLHASCRFPLPDSHGIKRTDPKTVSAFVQAVHAL